MDYEHLRTLKQNKAGTAAALGYFDGVHLGHAAVLSAAAEYGRDRVPTAVTFNSLPTGAKKKLCTNTVKERRMRALGIQEIVYLNFDRVKNQSPEEFVSYLRTGLNAEFVCCGYNFSFGKDAAGDAGKLEELCRSMRINVRVMPPVTCGDQPVSSTRIRKLLREGSIKQANELLGYAYEFDFTVSMGDKRGRTWGFPTINQIYDLNYVIPKFGVYASSAFVNGRWNAAVTNIGHRPMFASKYPVAETHILNYDGDLYGKRIPVRLHAYLREEKKFEDLETLIDTIRENCESAEQIFKTLKGR